MQTETNVHTGYGRPEDFVYSGETEGQVNDILAVLPKTASIIISWRYMNTWLWPMKTLRGHNIIQMWPTM